MTVFTVRHDGRVGAVYGVVRLSVCLSVCLSQVGVLLKRLNAGFDKQCHTIAKGLSFSAADDLGRNETDSPLTEAPNAGGIG